MSVKPTMEAVNKSAQTLRALMSALVIQAFSCPAMALVVMVSTNTIIGKLVQPDL